MPPTALYHVVSLLCFSNRQLCRAWWLIVRFDAFRPKGFEFESRSNRHVGSFSCSCLWRFGVKLRHSIRAVSGAPLSSTVLNRRYRNWLNEWMNLRSSLTLIDTSQVVCQQYGWKSIIIMHAINKIMIQVRMTKNDEFKGGRGWSHMHCQKKKSERPTLLPLTKNVESYR